MKILLIADEESNYLWDFYDASLFEDVDIIISAGDLKAKYLSFLTTVTRKRVYYVHGNHDNRYEKEPPLGCDTIEDKIIIQKGVRILGLGGSYRYKDGPHQYSEKEMRKRIRKLRVMIEQFGGVDIIVTHAPAKGRGDGEDLCHHGFEVFNELMDIYKPSYFLHGHQHLNYGHNADRIQANNETTIINGYNYHFFEFEKNNFPKTAIQAKFKFLNTLRFYKKYINTDEMKEYQKYKRYLKNIKQS